MKQIITFLLLLSCITTGISQKYNKTDTTSKGKLMLLGQVNRAGFDHEEFLWFKQNYETYQPNEHIINQLRDSINNYTIKAFLGTWCGDSRKEIPVLYKVLDAAGFDEQNLEVVALDNRGDEYKRSPTREEKDLNIHRVPTVIIYKNGEELNRIVEHPKETIERDLLNIMTNKKYKPHYQVVTFIENAFQKKTIDSLSADEQQFLSLISEYTIGSRELNTYGYVELHAGNIDKAIFIFELNSKIYPYRYRVFSSLGQAYYRKGELEKAIQNYAKVLALDPQNKKANEMINTITESITAENNQ